MASEDKSVTGGDIGFPEGLNLEGETLKKVQDGDLFILTGEEMKQILPWIHKSLTEQAKHASNWDQCLILNLMLKRGSELYGTEPENRKTCICEG